MLQRDAEVKFSTGASGPSPPRLSSVPQPVNPPGPGECYVISVVWLLYAAANSHGEIPIIYRDSMYCNFTEIPLA